MHGAAPSSEGGCRVDLLDDRIIAAQFQGEALMPSLDPARFAGLDLRYDAATKRFTIIVPEFANIAEDTIGRHASGERADSTALIFEALDGRPRVFTYRELDQAACRLAVRLRRMGVERGDVVAIHTGPRPETALAHMAVYKLGAVAGTLSQLYGPDTLLHILNDCRAKVLVTQDEVWEPFRPLRDRLPHLRHCIVAGDARDGEIRFDECLSEDAGSFVPVRTRSEDPALLIYTSGSTGLPKGILHAHRILHAYKPTLELFYNLELREPGLVFWTPADWAWIGGYVDVVLPGWLFGHKVIASQHRFEAEWALNFMARHEVTHSLMTPTALRRLAQTSRPREGRGLKLRTIFTGGEALPGETLRWLHDELGVVCNEGYGLSEVNHMIGNCLKLRPIKPGSMGWGFPGHEVRLIDENGAPVADGEPGEIVTSEDDPTLFLGYFGNPELTRTTRLGQWVRTHDLAVCDADGYYWYRGRNDDLIKSAGYRIGPAEIEDVLASHPSVAEIAVIGSPDSDRGHIVKAFVRLRQDWAPSDELIAELQAFVKGRLAAYKYPRQIEFVDEFPTTSTGKISRAKLRERDLASRATGAAGA